MALKRVRSVMWYHQWLRIWKYTILRSIHAKELPCAFKTYLLLAIDLKVVFLTSPRPALAVSNLTLQASRATHKRNLSQNLQKQLFQILFLLLALIQGLGFARTRYRRRNIIFVVISVYVPRSIGRGITFQRGRSPDRTWYPPTLTCVYLAFLSSIQTKPA